MSFQQLPRFKAPPPLETDAGFPSTNARRRTSTLLLAVTIVLFALTVLGVDGKVRFVVGLVFAVAVPGWSIVGLLRLKEPSLEVGLSVAVSLALIMVAAQLMMTWNLWHPVALEELSCVVCAISLTHQAGVSRGWRGKSP